MYLNWRAGVMFDCLLGWRSKFRSLQASSSQNPRLLLDCWRWLENSGQIIAIPVTSNLITRARNIWTLCICQTYNNILNLPSNELCRVSGVRCGMQVLLFKQLSPVIWTKSMHRCSEKHMTSPRLHRFWFHCHNPLEHVVESASTWHSHWTHQIVFAGSRQPFRQLQ